MNARLDLDENTRGVGIRRDSCLSNGQFWQQDYSWRSEEL